MVVYSSGNYRGHFGVLGGVKNKKNNYEIIEKSIKECMN